jgi:hypothetical protein
MTETKNGQVFFDKEGQPYVFFNNAYWKLRTSGTPTRVELADLPVLYTLEEYRALATKQPPATDAPAETPQAPTKPKKYEIHVFPNLTANPVAAFRTAEDAVKALSAYAPCYTIVQVEDRALPYRLYPLRVSDILK